MSMRSPLVCFFALSAAALMAQAPPAFEVATIRPTAGPIPGIPPLLGHQETTADTLTARHTQLIEIIRRAYGVGGPGTDGRPRLDSRATVRHRRQGGGAGNRRRAMVDGPPS